MPGAGRVRRTVSAVRRRPAVSPGSPATARVRAAASCSSSTNAACPANGRFYSTPDLRAGLGLDDEQFDGCVMAHPEISAWYDGAVAAGN